MNKITLHIVDSEKINQEFYYGEFCNQLAEILLNNKSGDFLVTSDNIIPFTNEYEKEQIEFSRVIEYSEDFDKNHSKAIGYLGSWALIGCSFDKVELAKSERNQEDVYAYYYGKHSDGTNRYYHIAGICDNGEYSFHS